MDVLTQAYDRRGNLTRVTANSQLQASYTFDATNMMTEAFTAGKGRAEYTYSGFRNRIKKLEELPGADLMPDPAKEIRYVLDMTLPYDNLLMTKGAQKQNFIWGNGLIAVGGEEKYYYLQDHLGSPIRLLGHDTGDTPLAYDEFGVPLADAGQASKGLHNPFGFTGYQTDDLTGLYYAQARYYMPQTGRFTSEDIIKGHVANPQSLNDYTYCRNSPLALVDPDGRFPMPSLGGIKNLIIPTADPVLDWTNQMADSAWDQAKQTANSAWDQAKQMATSVRDWAVQEVKNNIVGTDTTWSSVPLKGVPGATTEVTKHTGGNIIVWTKTIEAETKVPTLGVKLSLPSGLLTVPGLGPLTVPGSELSVRHDFNGAGMTEGMLTLPWGKLDGVPQQVRLSLFGNVDGLGASYAQGFQQGQWETMNRVATNQMPWWEVGLVAVGVVAAAFCAPEILAALGTVGGVAGLAELLGLLGNRLSGCPLLNN